MVFILIKYNTIRVPYYAPYYAFLYKIQIRFSQIGYEKFQKLKLLVTLKINKLRISIDVNTSKETKY